MKIQIIPVETASVGDLVTISWVERDVTKTAKSRIHDIQLGYGGWRKLISETGIVFAEYNIKHRNRVMCVLHDRKSEPSTELFGTDWVEQLKEKIA